MDSECAAANLQPQMEDGTSPSHTVSQTARNTRRASESAEARLRRLLRERARRKQRLASKTAEERERRLSQRRIRDRARRSAHSSPTRETRLEHKRSAERQRRAMESPQQIATRQRRRRPASARLDSANSSDCKLTPEETETCLSKARLSQQQRLQAETPDVLLFCEYYLNKDWMISHKSFRIHLSPGSQPQKCVIVTAAGIFTINLCVTFRHNNCY